MDKCKLKANANRYFNSVNEVFTGRGHKTVRKLNVIDLKFVINKFDADKKPRPVYLMPFSAKMHELITTCKHLQPDMQH